MGETQRDVSLVTSPFFSSLVLGCLRGIIGLYALLTLIINLAIESAEFHEGQSFFSYFTNLSLTGLAAYFIAATVQTIIYARRNAFPLRTSWPRILLHLHTILLSTVVTFPILVTIVFWALLASPSSVAPAWSNISAHALNTVYALFEISLTNIDPIPWLHLIPCIVILGGYLGVAYITHATQGFYTYAFLDPAEGPILAGYIIGIAVAECIIFVVVRYLIVARKRLAKSRNERITVSSLGETAGGSPFNEKRAATAQDSGHRDVPTSVREIKEEV